MMIFFGFLLLGVLLVLELKYGLISSRKVQKGGLKGLMAPNSALIKCQYCDTEFFRGKNSQECPNCYRPI
ncbi:hypothetical protein ACSVDE_02125 [Pseudalkalibacillus sp. Hm43]|uniref:hypothetical protein n=1 Tax=Pseudalkalibacillus sp. Hm43 TaxID=3450742 RepID=UPI003F430CC9